MVSGDPQIRSNKYHQQSIIENDMVLWVKYSMAGRKVGIGSKYIVYAIGFAISPIRIVYELLKFAIYIVNVALNMIPKYTNGNSCLYIR